MNRKLIRPTLAEVRNKSRETTPPQAKIIPAAARQVAKETTATATAASAAAAVQVRKRQPPPAETHAELYYYKKQIDAHTPMVIVLQDDEEIEGTIEWYDKGALKVNRKNAPNLLLLKHNIKYMFKVEERDGTKSADDGDDD